MRNMKVLSLVVHKLQCMTKIKVLLWTTTSTTTTTTTTPRLFRQGELKRGFAQHNVHLCKSFHNGKFNIFYLTCILNEGFCCCIFYSIYDYAY